MAEHNVFRSIIVFLVGLIALTVTNTINPAFPGHIVEDDIRHRTRIILHGVLDLRCRDREQVNIADIDCVQWCTGNHFFIYTHLGGNRVISEFPLLDRPASGGFSRKTAANQCCRITGLADRYKPTHQICLCILGNRNIAQCQTVCQHNGGFPLGDFGDNTLHVRANILFRVRGCDIAVRIKQQRDVVIQLDVLERGRRLGRNLKFLSQNRNIRRMAVCCRIGLILTAQLGIRHESLFICHIKCDNIVFLQLCRINYRTVFHNFILRRNPLRSCQTVNKRMGIRCRSLRQHSHKLECTLLVIVQGQRISCLQTCPCIFIGVHFVVAADVYLRFAVGTQRFVLGYDTICRRVDNLIAFYLVVVRDHADRSLIAALADDDRAVYANQAAV